MFVKLGILIPECGGREGGGKRTLPSTPQQPKNNNISLLINPSSYTGY